MKRMKKSLSQRHLKKETRKYVEIGKAPIISVSITLADGATVETTGSAISLLAKAVGDENASAWHAKYMDKFNTLTKKCYADLEKMVKEAKEEKGA